MIDRFVLPEWLAPDDLDWFERNHFGRAPCARPGGATEATSLCTWETLAEVLGSELPVDVLTVAAGKTVEVRPPRSHADVMRMMKTGVSTVVRAAEKHVAGLARLAERFERVLPGEVHVQLYATPAGTNSYGWHYDFEDVFIAQTAGVKDYYFRANTVARDAVLGDNLNFTSFRNERSPLMSARLIAGDWLYLPARWWHLVKCVEDSLSISVGVMSPGELQRARRLPAGWTGDRRAGGAGTPPGLAAPGGE
jgi:ribosomal protein L16 Arg81 hydroxylase